MGLKVKIKLKEALSGRNSNLRQASKRLGVDYQRIIRFSSGEMAYLPVELIERICEEYGLEVGEVVGLEKIEDLT